MATKPTVTTPSLLMLSCTIFMTTASLLEKVKCKGTIEDPFTLLAKWGKGFEGGPCFMDVDLSQSLAFWNCSEGGREWFRETENNYVHHYAGDRVYTMIDGVAYYLKQPSQCIESELLSVEVTADRDHESALISMVPEEGAVQGLPSRLEAMCGTKFSQVIASTSESLQCANEDEPTDSATYNAYWLGYPGCSTYDFGCGYPNRAGYGCDNVLQSMIHQCTGNSAVQINLHYVNALLLALCAFMLCSTYSLLCRNRRTTEIEKYAYTEVSV